MQNFFFNCKYTIKKIKYVSFHLQLQNPRATQNDVYKIKNVVMSDYQY